LKTIANPLNGLNNIEWIMIIKLVNQDYVFTIGFAGIIYKPSHWHKLFFVGLERFMQALNYGMELHQEENRCRFACVRLRKEQVQSWDNDDNINTNRILNDFNHVTSGIMGISWGYPPVIKHGWMANPCRRV
jgi:hypothetical protein